MPFPILSIDLPDSILMLNERAKNWLTFAAGFEDEMRTRGIWGHFDGSAYRPCDADAEGIRFVWEKTEHNARYLLSEWLADSTYLRIWKLDSVKESRPVLGMLSDVLPLHRVRSQGKRTSVQRDPPAMIHLPKMSKTTPKLAGDDEEGVVYMAEELALEAEGSGPVHVSRTSVFCEDDDEACDFIGGGFFSMPEVVEVEQEDAEDAGDALGAMSTLELLKAKPVCCWSRQEALRTSNQLKNVSTHLSMDPMPGTSLSRSWFVAKRSVFVHHRARSPVTWAGRSKAHF
jgi:hypothetical protein